MVDCRAGGSGVCGGFHGTSMYAASMYETLFAWYPPIWGVRKTRADFYDEVSF
jgi:hypothetical protein